MSTFPKKCTPIANAEAYKAINKRLIGQYIRIDFKLNSQATYGYVKGVTVGRVTKNIKLEFPSGEIKLLEGFHDMAHFTLTRYRNIQHYLTAIRDGK